MLEYSPEGKDALPCFYRDYNDIDVFIEDDSLEIFYQEILGKLLNKSIKITRIFSTSGKSELLEKFHGYIESSEIDKAFFIVDPDFDHILGTMHPSHARLHILDEYCIENYLFEEKAFISVCLEEKPGKRIDWDSKVNYSAWLEGVTGQLTPLFACFIYTQKKGISEPNVGLGIGKFISGSPPSLDPKRIDAFIVGFKCNAFIAEGSQQDIDLQQIVSAMGATSAERKRYISGKDFMFPLLSWELTRHTNKKIDHESLRFRIMKHCTLTSLHRLKMQIESILLRPT